MSRLLTAVQTAPSGAMAKPVPLRTPVAKGWNGPPPGGMRMIVARCGVAERSSGETLPVEPPGQDGDDSSDSPLGGEEPDAGDVWTGPSSEAPATTEQPESLAWVDRRPDGYRPGMDVVHDVHGSGWVWGTGLGRVTIRFETAQTGPGPVRTFAVDDDQLSPADN